MRAARAIRPAHLPAGTSTLAPAELQALVAHEVGHDYFWHDYFWEEYERARVPGDAPTLQELELKCDGIAVLTLVGLGLNPAALGDGVRKLTRFNPGVHAMASAGESPSLQEREQFARKLLASRLVRAPMRVASAGGLAMVGLFGVLAGT